ncbi:MAG: heterodisulfide reductase-related iron-sulfur binding cluster [Thermoprotei archaeon]|jgi:Fe-S oxidoreductase
MISESWIITLRNIMEKSLRENMLPLPISKSICHKWASGLNLKKDSDTILYTSCLYQIVPYIDSFIEYMERFNVSKGRFSSLIPIFSRFSFLLQPKKELVEKSEKILRNIVNELSKTVNFGYLYDEEPYSGALLYELGFEDAFREYAKKVTEIFGSKGIKKIITIDPHTHYILKVVYPKIINFNIEVINYLELIKPDKKVNLNVAIHDSCLYSRFLGMYDTYRKILDNMSIERKEHQVFTARDVGGCCGGPIESLTPEISKRVAKIRVNELSKLSKNIVVVCPICLANLSRVSDNVNIIDLAELL